MYDDVLVIQIATLGMEKLKPLVVDVLSASLRPRSIIERSDLPARREEGLEPLEALLAGEAVDKGRILEAGIPYSVGLAQGQKTGFYLDQRESRKLVREFAAGRRVLNCFAYTGSFSVCALLGGAVRADSVDTSAAALELAQENFELNGLSAASGLFFAADVFEFLREPALDHDFVILDPPAFAKKKTDVVAACRGYKDINRLALQRIKAPGLAADLLLFPLRRRGALPAGRLPGRPRSGEAGAHPSEAPAGLRPSRQRLSPRDILPERLPPLRRLKPPGIRPGSGRAAAIA